MININTMNKKIQELARQAGFYANPDVEKFKKFAELIVRECIDIAYREGDDVAYLAQHFGARTDSVSEDPIAKIDRLFRGQ